ncbi:MAG: hypothetical protein H0T73_10250 [Ardenticatenales bacterium]|nr:hypothetical protein [Ardenticatenales bacterium]
MQLKRLDLHGFKTFAGKTHFLFSDGIELLAHAGISAGTYAVIGQARLEIIAPPSGKRAQSISLLSGGERALTVLDEVDAMLDEANVGRFRAMLAELSHKTHFCEKSY